MAAGSSLILLNLFNILSFGLVTFSRKNGLNIFSEIKKKLNESYLN